MTISFKEILITTDGRGIDVKSNALRELLRSAFAEGFKEGRLSDYAGHFMFSENEAWDESNTKTQLEVT